jgi:hypothetical protein
LLNFWNLLKLSTAPTASFIFSPIFAIYLSLSLFLSY